MLMEIKGDLGLWGDLHDPEGIELLGNGDFQTTSVRQGGQLCHFDCGFSLFALYLHVVEMF